MRTQLPEQIAENQGMPRSARYCPPATFQHVISEFVDREYWLADEEDRRCYLSAVTQSAKPYDGRLLAYALMSSHVHWWLLAGTLPLGTLFQPAHTRYAGYWHRRYGGRGPVFANRPENHEVQPAAVASLVAYIHMNPVRAGVCRCPADSTWTSHRAYLRLAPAPAWLNVEQALALCGFRSLR
jgi:REP element-mobilizing transposase RayT